MAMKKRWEVDLYAELKKITGEVANIEKQDEEKVQKCSLGKMAEQHGDKLAKAIDKSYHDGKALLEEILEQIKSDLDSLKQVMIFRILREKNVNRADHYELVTFDGKKRKAKIRYVSKRKMYEHIIGHFSWMLRKWSANNAEEQALFVVGEGEMLQECIERFPSRRDRFNSIESIHYLAGPFMVHKANDRMNDFVRYLVRRSSKKSEITFSRNRLLPLKKLYAGYFHCYIIGDNILLELPHEFMHERSNLNHIILFNNGKYAKKLRDFFGRYAKFFAEKQEFSKGEDENKIRQEVLKLYEATINAKTEKISIDNIAKLILEKSAEMVSG